MFLHNLLNVLVQIANKMGLQKNKNVQLNGITDVLIGLTANAKWHDMFRSLYTPLHIYQDMTAASAMSNSKKNKQE
jgi:hypothetical protein